MQIIRQSAFTSTPWKNGGGITREAVRAPSGGDEFRWRVSVAHINRSGPFSEFAGYNRVMVLLEGNGVALTFADGGKRVLRRAGDKVEFDGAVATQCDLIDGKCTDLNLIAAKSLRGVHATIERARARLRLPNVAGHSTLIFPIDAPVEVDADREHASLRPWDLAIVGHAAAGAQFAPQAAGDAALVFVATVPDA